MSSLTADIVEPVESTGDGRIKVLFVDHTAALGGGELAMLNLASRLNPGRFDVHVLLFSDGPLAGRLRGAGVATHILPMAAEVTGVRKDSLGFSTLFRFKDIARTIGQVLAVREFIRQGGYDIVHTNSLKADIIGGLAARLTSAALVWHIRDRICDNYLPAKVVRVFRLLCRFVPTFLIANSQSTLATVARGRDEGVVPSGVDVKVGQPVAARSDGPARVGLIGRLSPWKGQEVFIRAAAEILKTRPETKFAIVGAALFNEKEFETSLHKLVDELRLGDAIAFEGFRSDIPAVIQSLDVVVHASTVGEPFGQVVIEAMAEGKAVVATNGGGIPEIVVDGVTGLLVPMGDAGAMARAIGRLLADPAGAAEMGRLGRLRVEEHFTIGQTAEKVSEIYDHIMSSRRSARVPVSITN